MRPHIVTADTCAHPEHILQPHRMLGRLGHIAGDGMCGVVVQRERVPSHDVERLAAVVPGWERRVLANVQSRLPDCAHDDGLSRYEAGKA